MTRRFSFVFLLAGFAASLLNGTAFAQKPAADKTAPDKIAADKIAADAPDKSEIKAKDKKDKDDEYYELLKVFVDTLDQVERNYVDKVDRRELLESAIKGVLGKLDPYSNYISPGELTKFKDNVDSKFGGIGIQIGVENGILTIISPLVGSPAYREGLEAGDQIIEIEGKTTEGIVVDEAVQRLKGLPDTSVTIKIRRPDDGKIRDVKLTREEIHLDTVLGSQRKSDDSWDYMYDPEKKIAYIRITSFSRETTEELERALRELKDQGMKGLIIDLRFDPGGLLSAAIEIADLFVSEGKIVSTKGRNAEERVWEATKAGTYEGFPMAVLVNRYSASASEILAACLQDHKRAIVVGERTWGKGSVQNVIELEGGKSALKLTTASYWRPSGKNIHRMPDAKEWGVDPDPGYEVKIDGTELRDLGAFLRERDIVKRHEKPREPESSKKDPAKKDDKEEKKDEKKPDQTSKQDKEEKKEEPKKDDKKDEPKKTETKKEDKEKKKFVDRQFQKAFDYLTEQIAKDKK
jgi:carboxyl-terminal processing protease